MIEFFTFDGLGDPNI